ncbi:MAG: tetratricopeptide repeat protein [Bryobacteraceae bacterium]
MATFRVGIVVLAASLLLHGESAGRASYERANSLFVAKKFPEAAAALDEALAKDPDLVPALTLRAKLAMAARRYDVVRKSLEHALAVDPKSSYAQFLYGMEAYLNNEMTEALVRFRRARELAPSDPRPALYLGLTTESVGRPAEAMTLYEKAVRLARHAGQLDGETLLPGARLLLLLGRLDESETWLRDAVRLSPRLRDARFEFARLLLKKGNAAEAAENGEAALAAPEGTIDDNAIHYLLVRAWKAAGQPDRAAAHAAVMRAREATPP